VNRLRKPRADGVRSRQAILDASARLASIEGLGGLSLGVLAARLGMSKSGLYAHFGSKEDLELAVVAHAGRVLDAEVLEPAALAPPGIARLVAHCEAYLSYLQREVFPGGCFFAAAAAEFDTRSGAVRDAIVEVVDRLDQRVAGHLRDACAAGELPSDLDVDQLAFEIGAMLRAANATRLLQRSDVPLTRARQAIERLITHAATS
jgi:AcrR family transcriptional regulator